MSEDKNPQAETIRESSKKHGFIYKFFYYIGASTNMYLRRLRRFTGRYTSKISAALSFVWENTAVKFKNSIKSSITEIRDIISKTRIKCRRNREQINSSGEKGFSPRFAALSYEARAYSGMTAALFGKVLNYAAPVLAIAFFTFTVQFFTRLNYSVEVLLDGQHIGYVNSEADYEKAEKIMQSRIYYGDSADILYTTPTFRLDVVNEELIYTPEELSNEIVRAIGSNIKEAYGLYVDGEFIGAVADDINEEYIEVETAINAVLDQYRTGAAGEKIQFKKEVKLMPGLYLTETIIDAGTLVERVTGASEAEISYVITDEDTLSGIAEKMGVTVAQITALNPNISANKLKPGATLLVRANKPYLSVVKTGIITYEESLPYETVKTEDPSQIAGWTKTTTVGKNGKAEFVAEILLEDGVEISRTILERTVIAEPVNARVRVGIKAPATAPLVQNGQVAADPGATGPMFIWPVQSGGTNNGSLGSYRGHTGIDIQSFAGDATLAAADGTVTYAGYKPAYGYHVIIDHGNGYTTLYAHHSALYVVAGQYVTQNTPLGAQGRTGNATGIHLHFEIRYNGKVLNPLSYLPV